MKNWTKKKYQLIAFFDRDRTFRFAIPVGDTIPKGYIVGTGWTVTTRFEEQDFCQTCKTWVGLTDHGLDCNC